MTKRRPRKTTKRDSSRRNRKLRTEDALGPRRLAGKARAAELQAANRRVEDELEKRRRRDLAKAAIELDPVDVQILQYLMLRPWMTQEQIGDLVGLGRQAVNERIHAPKLQRALQESARSALEIFDSNKAKAARKLAQLIDDPDSRVAIRAAIAHMWPHIHADSDTTKGDELMKLLQEAYERAEANKPAAAAGGEKERA